MPRGGGKKKKPTGPPKVDATGALVRISRAISVKIEDRIGAGGFGVIYKGKRYEKEKLTGAAVIKMEYSSSSGLFSEMKCLERLQLVEWSAKKQAQWLRKSVLKHFPFAIMYGCSVEEFKGEDYRFMAMRSCGDSIARLIAKSNHNIVNSMIPVGPALSIALQMTEALRYVHEHGYIHGDLKPENICIDETHPGRVYLIDFGCCELFDASGGDMTRHEPYEVLQARRHDGTLEFTGVDAHAGAKLSRRGDLEMLCYVLLQFLLGEPSWFPVCAKVTNKTRAAAGDKVEKEKRRLFDYAGAAPMSTAAIKSAQRHLQTLLQNQAAAGEVSEYFGQVMTLAYEEAPDYTRLIKALQRGLKASKFALDKALSFSADVENQTPPRAASSSSSAKRAKRSAPAKPKSTPTTAAATTKASTTGKGAARAKRSAATTTTSARAALSTKRSAAASTRRQVIDSDSDSEDDVVVVDGPPASGPSNTSRSQATAAKAKAMTSKHHTQAKWQPLKMRNTTATTKTTASPPHAKPVRRRKRNHVSSSSSSSSSSAPRSNGAMEMDNKGRGGDAGVRRSGRLRDKRARDKRHEQLLQRHMQVLDAMSP